jgi:hypothetical protein
MIEAANRPYITKFGPMNPTPNLNEYATAEHALKYLARADRDSASDRGRERLA